MNDHEMIQKVRQTIKKLDDVCIKTFLVTLKALAQGFSMKEAVEVSNAILIKAGREPVPPELFERPGD